MALFWWVTSILFVGVLSIALFRICNIIEKYFSAKMSQSSKIRESLEKITEEYLKREFSRGNQNVESNERPIETKSSMVEPDRSPVEKSTSEEDLASLVSKRTETAVSFGEDVSE